MTMWEAIALANAKRAVQAAEAVKWLGTQHSVFDVKKRELRPRRWCDISGETLAIPRAQHVILIMARKADAPYEVGSVAYNRYIRGF